MQHMQNCGLGQCLCYLPGLSLSVRADSEERFPNIGGSEPVRLKSLSSNTATDWVKASVQPPARRVGVVGQQFTPYLQLRHLTGAVWCIVQIVWQYGAVIQRSS